MRQKESDKMKIIESVAMVLLMLLLSACSTVKEVSRLPDFSMVGHEVFTTVDHPELQTVNDLIVVNSADPVLKGCSGDSPSIDWHITKNAAAAYWNPGFDGAEIHWLTWQSSTGGWNAYRSL